MPPPMGIALVLLGALAASSPEARRSVGAPRVQRQFYAPNRTNNFAVEPASGRVYVATVNSLYQLDAALRVEAHRSTGPVEDNLLCHAPQLPQAPCQHPKSLTDNHNKLLELDRRQGVVVACGSVYQGFCELRELANVSRTAVEFPPAGEKTVFPSMLNIAANHPDASTVGLVLRGGGGGGGDDTRLLVAATYTGAGTRFFPKNHSKEDLRFENTPEIAIRSFDVGDLARLFTYDINPSEDNVFKIKQEAKAKNQLHFVRAFHHKTYSYVAFNNDAKTGHKESQPNSVLARICLDTAGQKPNGPESRKLTESYIQLPLQCGRDGDIYNRLLSVYPADVRAEAFLFGVFSKGDRRTALCAFKFADVEEEIRRGRRSCSNSPTGDVQVLDSVIQGSGAACVQKWNLVVSDSRSPSNFLKCRRNKSRPLE
ncbi:plexin-D1-like, partial [Hippocampus comes]